MEFHRQRGKFQRCRNTDGVSSFFIPALFGLLGIYKLWRAHIPLASALTLLFLLSGVCLAWAQNQQGPQPHEYDILYGGSFFDFFSMDWNWNKHSGDIYKKCICRSTETAEIRLRNAFSRIFLRACKYVRSQLCFLESKGQLRRL